MKNLDHLTDDELVRLYASGNNEAFDSLLDRYKSKLYSYIYYTVHDEDTANDVFQETFVKVICSIQAHHYAPSGKFYAWTTRIAHNIIMDLFRQNNNENTIAEDEEGLLLNEASLYDPSFEMQQIHNQSISDIVVLYKMLPKSQSEIVYMRFYQDMSFKEIADELGISINTALGRMRYALLNMKRLATEKNISFEL